MGDISEGDINEVRNEITTEDLQKEYRFQESTRKERELGVEYEKSLDNEFSSKKGEKHYED
jgi:hypothetical protein